MKLETGHCFGKLVTFVVRNLTSLASRDQWPESSDPFGFLKNNMAGKLHSVRSMSTKRDTAIVEMKQNTTGQKMKPQLFLRQRKKHLLHVSSFFL